MAGVKLKKVRKIKVPEQQAENRKLKVAAYCRVSTKHESQKSSIDLQIKYYAKYIEEQEDWEFAGIFMDYGSRCRIKGRENFQTMIHCYMDFLQKIGPRLICSDPMAI